MLVTILKLLGIDQRLGGGEIIAHIDEARLVYNGAIFWVGLILLVPLAVFIYLWQARNLPSAGSALRTILTACRIGVLFLLIVVLSDPHLELRLSGERRPIVALMFDHSQSMQLPAGPFDPGGETNRIAAAAGYRGADGKVDPAALRALDRIGRAKLGQTVVQAGQTGFINPIAEKYDFQVYTFGRETAKLPVVPTKLDLPEPTAPGGPATHLGDALAQVIDEAAGRPIAGVYLFTDGQNTGGSSPNDAAAKLRTLGTPLFTVPIGGEKRLRDVAIVDVFTSGQVTVGDTVRVAVTVESTGFDKRPAKIELRDGDKLVDTREIVLRGAEQQQVELSFPAKESGARYLTARIIGGDGKPFPEEAEHLRANNTDTAFVRVTEEKLRVLFIEGGPRWDYRFLKNSMERDTGLAGTLNKHPDRVLETEWRRTPNAANPAKAWPLTVEGKEVPRTLDGFGQYHVVILGDASPALLNAEFLTLLDKAIREKGVGLIVEAGPQNMPHKYGPMLTDLLPAKLASKRAGLLPQSKPFRVELAPEGGVHEAMRFYDDPGRNQVAWAQMQPYTWCAAVERLAPAATALAYNAVLANDYGKLPLICYHNAGAGKVMLVGTDSTWLWRANVGDRFFYKFWGQAIRFVARRDELAKKKSWLEVRPVRAQPGEYAQIELMAYDDKGVPRTAPTLQASVVGVGKAEVVALQADPVTKGRYTGRFLLTNVGDYTIRHLNGDEKLEVRLRVLIAPEELRFPNVNRPLLRTLAETSAGGALVELPELESTLTKLKGETKQVQAPVREASLWDNWLMLGLIILLYSLDVGLRRLSGLS